MNSTLTAFFYVSGGLLAGACVPALIYLTGQMHYQRCDAMGFKTGTLENKACVRILSSVPGEYQRELLDSLRGGK